MTVYTYGGDFSNPMSWTPNGIPGPGDTIDGAYFTILGSGTVATLIDAPLDGETEFGIGGDLVSNTATIDVEAIISVSGTWTNNGLLLDNGNIYIDSGDLITPGAVFGLGAISVAGPDASWFVAAPVTLDSIGVGDSASVTLDSVDVGGLSADTDGAIDVLNNATITGTDSGPGIDKLIVESGGSIDVTGTLTVDDAGALLSDDDSSVSAGSVIFGDTAGSEAFLEAGAQLDDQSALLGNNVGIDGEIIVDQSTWTTATEIELGYEGRGTLEVDGEGVATDATADLGVASTGLGVAEVESGTWTTTGTLTLGLQGDAMLTVGFADPGIGTSVVNDETANLGVATTGVGSAEIDAGATWTTTGNLTLGVQGAAMVNVNAGGVVSVTGALAIADLSGSTAVVNISGAGSNVTAASVGVGGDAMSAGGAATVNITTTATLSVSGAAAIWNGATVDLTDGTLSARTVALSAEGRIVGDGDLKATGPGAAISDAGTVEASGGLLNVFGPLSGAGTLVVGEHATLDLVNSVAAGLTVSFEAGVGTLDLGVPMQMAGTINGFTGLDVIQLVSIDADSAVLDGNDIVVSNGTVPVVTLATSGLDPDDMFDVTQGTYGAVIKLGGGAAGTPSPPSQPLVTTVPAQLVGAVGTAVSIPGASVSDPNADVTTTVTVILTDGDGTLAATAEGGQVSATNGGHSLAISGTLAQVNAELRTLTYTAAAAGADTITVNTTDSLGNGDSHQILVADAPTVSSLSGPGSVTPGNGGPDTVVSASGSATVTTGANNAQVFLGSGVDFVASNAADTIVGGSAAVTVSAAGTPLYFGAGDTTLFDALGASATLVGGAAETVNAGGANVLLFAGSGSLDFMAGSGASSVVGGSGGNTITGGTGPLLYFGNATNFYTAGSAVDTVVGFDGSLTATGGANGTLFFTGTAGGSDVGTGSGSSTIIGFGVADSLTATGSGADVIEAAAASETINATASSGTNTFFAFGQGDVVLAGSGSTAVQSYVGNQTLAAGSGADLFAVVDSGQRAVTFLNFTQGQDFVQLQGYAAGTGAAAPPSAVLAGGSEVLTLPDGTTLTFQGVTGLAASSFV